MKRMKTNVPSPHRMLRIHVTFDGEGACAEDETIVIPRSDDLPPC